MANKVYYKLGEQAGVFYDASLRILIRKGEVLELDKAPKSKKFNMAKAGGHVSVASKEEYDEFLASKNIKVEAIEVAELVDTPKDDEVPLKGKLTPDELALKTTLEGLEDNQAIIEYFRGDGMLEEDLEKLTLKVSAKKGSFIKLALDLNREYK